MAARAFDENGRIWIWLETNKQTTPSTNICRNGPIRGSDSDYDAVAGDDSV